MVQQGNPFGALCFLPFWAMKQALVELFVWGQVMGAQRAGRRKGAWRGDRERCNFIAHCSILPWQLVTSWAVKIPLKNEGSVANY